MNSMIVTIMKGNMHASLKAIDCYIHFHRLLIAMVKEFPEISTLVTDRMASFVKDPHARSKKSVPSMGDFLPCTKQISLLLTFH